MRKLKKRPTIGLQITNLIQEYPKQIFKGVTDMAQELDVNLIIFRGESPNTPYGYGYQCNVIYDLIHADYIDALIVASGTLCNYIPAEEFNNYLSKFKSIPLISLSVPVKGIPSILIDNSNGIREAVEHLVLVHNRKKIAFIKGAESNPEAVIRYKTFVEEMKNNKMAIDEDLIYSGNWTEWSGKDAVNELLDKRKADFDGLIVSNDEMAIGALKELTSRGIDIPDRVSIMGFDDIQDCEYSIPTLSTIKQPLYQQGRLAMKCAYDIIHGRSLPETMVLPTKSVLRSSCGCIGLSFKKAGVNPINIKPEINDILMMSDNLVPDKKDIFEIVDKLIEISRNRSRPSHNEILKSISKTITAELMAGKDVTVWKPIFNVLRDFIYRENCVNKSFVKKIIEESLVVARDLFYSREVANRITVERSVINTRTAVLEINASLSYDELCSKIIDNTKMFGVKGCYVFNYDKIYEHGRNDAWKIPEQVVPFLIYNGKIDLRVNISKDYLIKEHEYIPRYIYDTPENHILLVAPNYYLNHQYGYIIYDMGVRDGNVYDFISLAISSNYRSVLLLNESRNAETKLRRVLSELEDTNKKLAGLAETDELTGLLNRRGFIRFAGQQYELARQIQQNGILFYIDMDGLKLINDRFGHDSGDTAIKLCGEILKKVFRRMDVIGRIGGDEFVILTINTDENTREIIIKRLLSVIDEYNKSRNYQFKLSLSIGESYFNWDEDISIELLMGKADKILYGRKKEKSAKQYLRP